MGGYIMQLQNYSVNDGDGIRTVIFLAGCPLRCAWCANPEGQTLQNPMTRWAETEEILAEVRRQEIFYRASGGGVTFSGGADNGRILQNLARTARLGIPMTVRIPVILGVNGSEEDMAAAFGFLSRHCPGATLELLPYHRYGEGKYRRLGLALPDAAFGTPTPSQLERWRQMAREAGLTPVSFR